MAFGKKARDATYSLSLIPDTDIALFRWVGPINLEDRINNIRLMADFCNKNDVRKILVDGRDQRSETDLLDSFDLGTRVPATFRDLWAAIVCRPDDESLRSIETIAFNRGASTRSFNDFDTARSWLESVSSEGPTPPNSES